MDGYKYLQDGSTVPINIETTQFILGEWKKTADIATQLAEALQRCLDDMTDGDTVEPHGYLGSINRARQALSRYHGEKT